MKNKLIAIVLTTAVIGGVGSTAYAAEISSNNTSNVVVSKSKSNCSYKKKHDRLSKKKHPFHHLVCNNRPTNCPGNGDIEEVVPPTIEDIPSIDEVIPPTIEDTPSIDEVIPPTIEDTPSIDEVVPPTTEDTPSIDEVVPPTIEDTPSVDEVVPPTIGDTPSVDEVVPPTIEETPSVSDKFMAEVEQKIYEKINEERSKAGVATLSYNSTMEKYARIKSQDMGDRGYFDHVDPEGNLITVKMQQDGVRYNAWGENIAYIGGVSDADALATQFMNNWMNSQGHRENILSTNFTSVGVGVYKSGNRVYATQEFYR